MISEKMIKLGNENSCIRRIFDYGLMRKAEIGAENVFDFSLGNPSVPMPADILSEFLSVASLPENHQYTSSAGDLEVRKKIAEYIKAEFGFQASSENIYMTCGAAASLTVVLNAIYTDGNECIALAPFFPEYKVFAEKAGYKFTICPTEDKSFQIDEKALREKITPDTKCIIINSPNNPSGVIFTEKSIKLLAKVLSEKEKEYGHPVFLISDEPYRELAFDGKEVPYVPKYYKNTIVCYSYSKSLSIPGDRIGYIFVSPECERSKDIFSAVIGAGRIMGFVCAPSILQHFIGRVCGKMVDIGIYEKNRDLLYQKLYSLGFDITHPDGAFYMFIKSPNGDSAYLTEKAKECEILIVPSDDFGVSGYIRIAYCKKTEEITDSFPAWEKLAEKLNLQSRR